MYPTHLTRPHRPPQADTHVAHVHTHNLQHTPPWVTTVPMMPRPPFPLSWKSSSVLMVTSSSTCGVSERESRRGSMGMVFGREGARAGEHVCVQNMCRANSVWIESLSLVVAKGENGSANRRYCRKTVQSKSAGLLANRKMASITARLSLRHNGKLSIQTESALCGSV